MPTCIYCRAATTEKEPEAHIWPESLMGDLDFKLTHGEVCGSCNGAFSELERRFIDCLGPIAFLVGSRKTKRGKDRKISRPGFSGTWRDDMPSFHLNAGEENSTAYDGTIVSPSRLERGHDRYEIELPKGHTTWDGKSRTRMNQEMRIEKRTIRVLTKVALETVCFQVGAEACLDARLDEAREYARYGRGRRYLVAPRQFSVNRRGQMKADVVLSPVIASADTTDWLASIYLGPLIFTVDLSPECRYVRDIASLPEAERAFLAFLPEAPA